MLKSGTGINKGGGTAGVRSRRQRSLGRANVAQLDTNNLPAPASSVTKCYILV